MIGVTDLARSRKIGKLAKPGRGRSAAAARGRPARRARRPRNAARRRRRRGLKEAFDRDSRRLDLEREQLAAERERAERALRLELRRQAADREIGRLRLLAGIAVASWIGTLFFSARLIGRGQAAPASRWAAGGCCCCWRLSSPFVGAVAR